MQILWQIWRIFWKGSKYWTNKYCIFENLSVADTDSERLSRHRSKRR